MAHRPQLWLLLTLAFALLPAAMPGDEAEFEFQGDVTELQGDEAEFDEGDEAEFDFDEGSEEDFEFLDDDDDDDGDMDEDQASPGTGPLEEFDRDEPEESRSTRMHTCVGLAVGHFQVHSEELQDDVEQMIESSSMSQDQAVNSILFTWAMTCYLNIDHDTLEQAPTLGELSQEMGDFLFKPQPENQNPSRASKREWRLLERVVQEYQAAQDGEGKSNRSKSRPAEILSVDGANSMLYVVGVFGVIFGVCALVVRQLVKGERERQCASDRKADKAERKAKKRA